MTAPFEGKVALVTGGNSGIGQAAVLAFARSGARVVIAARRSPEGEATVELVKGGGEAIFIQTDVAQTGQVTALIRHAVETYGRLDYAFNNAGGPYPFAATADQAEADWDQVVTTHLKGVWLCMKYEIPQMLKQGSGAIVNMSSLSGLVGFAFGLSPYMAAKHGVAGVTKAAALEYAKMGIRD